MLKKNLAFLCCFIRGCEGSECPMQTTQIDAIFHKPLIRLNLRANFKALPLLPPENLA